jgi:RNA recognition motif-containing protein
MSRRGRPASTLALPVGGGSPEEIGGSRPQALYRRPLYSTTSDGLREFFSQSGNVLSATVITDRFSGQSRGFGFVEMAAAEEAQNAISQLNGRELDGRRITVEISNPQAPRSGGGGGGRPGGGRPGGGRPGGGRPGGGGGRESGYAHRPSKPVKW